jgi:hypothetical protein
MFMLMMVVVFTITTAYAMEGVLNVGYAYISNTHTHI